jgi:hypothetical protein
MASQLPPFSEEASAQTPYFVFDPLDFKFFYFGSREDALAYAALEVIPFYRDSNGHGYCTDVSWVAVGRISHVVECSDSHFTCALAQLPE